MFKNKLLNIMIIILLVLTLLGGAAVATITFMNKSNVASSEPSIDKIIERTVDIEEMTASLNDDSYVVFSLKLQTDSKKAQKELEKRAFQVKNIIIREFASYESTTFKSTEGLQDVEDLLKVKVNEIMTDGTIDNVYFTNCIVQ